MNLARAVLQRTRTTGEQHVATSALGNHCGTHDQRATAVVGNLNFRTTIGGDRTCAIEAISLNRNVATSREHRAQNPGTGGRGRQGTEQDLLHRGIHPDQRIDVASRVERWVIQTRNGQARGLSQVAIRIDAQHQLVITTGEEGTVQRYIAALGDTGTGIVGGDRDEAELVAAPRTVAQGIAVAVVTAKVDIARRQHPRTGGHRQPGVVEDFRVGGGVRNGDQATYRALCIGVGVKACLPKRLRVFACGDGNAAKRFEQRIGRDRDILIAVEMHAGIGDTDPRQAPGTDQRLDRGRCQGVSAKPQFAIGIEPGAGIHLHGVGEVRGMGVAGSATSNRTTGAEGNALTGGLDCVGPHHELAKGVGRVTASDERRVLADLDQRITVDRGAVADRLATDHAATCTGNE